MFVSSRPHVQIALKREQSRSKALATLKRISNASLIIITIAVAYISLLAITV